MKTRDLIIVANFAALSFVLSFFKVWQMPNGGSISLYLIPLLFIALRKNFKLSLFCCLLTAVLQIIFGGYIIGFFQVLLDYVFPVAFISLLSLVRNRGLYLQIAVVVIIGVLAMSSYIASGMIYFKVDFLGSLIYNATYFIPTIIINAVVAFIIHYKAKFNTV